MWIAGWRNTIVAVVQGKMKLSQAVKGDVKLGRTGIPDLDKRQSPFQLSEIEALMRSQRDSFNSIDSGLNPPITYSIIRISVTIFMRLALKSTGL